ncbi:TOPRIM nucleotidyl transferase/hydrolase domain-containing protein [Microbispora sp. H11081]|uniref:TOPRIM nucleotidyl transferase/hydrolase domain-containing protein n=1 Tax=Microbispora sp. H11081 TaxID=2729107 RepID=UPI002016048D|nr:TOPRIM nucleotidyl transferase/hydrolase domain-containing protein [Microbispora sp. H11081]
MATKRRSGTGDERGRPGEALRRRALDGYASGPDAPIRALERALTKAADAVTVVLVEGPSDQIALETAAVGRGRDLDAEKVVIVPIGGAHAIGRFLAGLGPPGTRVRLAGLCDLHEEEIFRRALVANRVGSPRTRADMEQLGFYVCVRDLEDELIRAVGSAEIEALFDVNGDLRAFRSLRSQPEWRGREPEAQIHRFMGGGSRKLRYARLLVEEAIGRDRLPRPLDALLDAVCGVRKRTDI